MATGTGLDAQLGFAVETTVGTAATPSKFIEFDSETLAYQPSWIEPSGLRTGVYFKRGSRLVNSRHSVSGNIAFQHATRTMGTLWKVVLGSSATATQIGTSGAYVQVHQVGTPDHALTIQVGRPEPDGTVRPHTYYGCKPTSWEFSVSDNETARMSVEFDGWNETTGTSLAMASFVPAEVFDFTDVSDFRLGVTISGTNDMTCTGGTPVSSVVRAFTIQGEWPLANERYGLGNAGEKAEQLLNGTPVISGTLEAEYDQSEFYDLFKAIDGTSMTLRMVKSAIGTSGENDTLEFIIPEIRIKNVSPQVSGPDLVQASVEWEAYYDESHPVLQVKIISADSSI